MKLLLKNNIYITFSKRNIILNTFFSFLQLRIIFFNDNFYDME